MFSADALGVIGMAGNPNHPIPRHSSARDSRKSAPLGAAHAYAFKHPFLKQSLPSASPTLEQHDRPGILDPSLTYAC